MKKLGIIAGAGELPVLLARAAIAHDQEPVVIQITKSDAERFCWHRTRSTYLWRWTDSKDCSDTP